MSRVILMQVIATNMCAWIRTIVWESEVELNIDDETPSNSTVTEYETQAVGGMKNIQFLMQLAKYSSFEKQ